MQYTKALRWILLIGLGLVFFLPFIVADGHLAPNMFFPYITGKNFAFRILVEALLGVYVILALREPKYRPKSSYLLWVLCAFVLWIGVATVFSADPVKSFWSNFERMEGYITVLHLFVYFVIAGAVISAEEWWDRLFQVAVAAGALQALYSLGQLLHIGGLAPSSQSGARLDGTFGNAAYLAVFMLFTFFITLLMLVRQRRSALAQSLYGIVLVLSGATIYYSQTRGAILGTLGGLVVAALYVAWRARDRQWRGLRRISLWGLGAVAILVILFFALRTSPLLQKSQTLGRIASISLSDKTTISRFYIWGMAWHGFVQSPKTVVLGWGQENFSFVFNKYYVPQMYDQEQWFDRAHNQFLDWLIDGGLPAFFLYVSFFVLIVWSVMRSDLDVPEQAILLGLLAAYIFNNLFVFDDLMSSLWFFTLLALAHSLSREKLPGRIFLSRPVRDRGIAIAAPIVLVISLFGIWTLNAPGIAKAENLLTAIIPQQDPAQSLAEFKTALGRNVWPGTQLGTQEVTEQLLQFSSTQASDTTVDPSVKSDTATLAESAGEAINTQRPHDARLELFMGAFYDSFGQYTQANQWLQKALADSPKKQQIMFELGVSDINAGDLTDAVSILKTAFDEEPDYSDARILYASALYYAGQNQTADNLLISGPTDEGFGTVLVDDSRLLQVYVATKQYDRVIGIWKNRVAKSPNDAQQYVGLATAYFVESDIPDTIAALQKAASIDPSLASQVQSIIDQINSGTLKPGQ